MEKTNYLSRFDASLLKEVSIENLAELQHLHMQHIPFENLDVIRRVPIYLNLHRIYEKIVENNRGGYCYEVNGLFNWLLVELGYNSHLVAATVRKPSGEWAKADTHAAILVQLDQPYLVDVGFGAATPRLPIPLSGEERTDINGVFSAKIQSSHTFDLVLKTDSGERTLYRFSTDKKVLVDFHEGCVFNQVAKESSFTHTDIVTRATPTGRITLSDQQLTVTENGFKDKSNLTAEEKIYFLQKSFRIRLD
jgi:N-hydroxyarylamine O-acetyltransferase